MVKNLDDGEFQYIPSSHEVTTNKFSPFPIFTFLNHRASYYLYAYTHTYIHSTLTHIRINKYLSIAIILLQIKNITLEEVGLLIYLEF